MDKESCVPGKTWWPEEMPLTGYPKWAEETTVYQQWYFDHFHIDAELWKNQFVMFDAIRGLHSGNLVRMRI